MKNFFLAVLGLVAVLFGIELYRSKKSGKTLKQQMKDDVAAVKAKTNDVLLKAEQKLEKIAEEKEVVNE